MKKALIMGNGPSVKDMPLDYLLLMDSFAVNYALHQPTFYVCVDNDILLTHYEKIYHFAADANIAFLSARHQGTSRLYDLPNVQLVGHDKAAFLGEHYFTGLTVTYMALKCAYYLGYEEIHLWGIDHSPSWEHYSPDYPRGDVDRRAWRMQEMEFHYALAARVYKQANRRIINHSNPSKLDDIFERQKGE